MTVAFRPLRVLIGCETSGMVRRAFQALGHDVWSCDLLPADDRSNRHMICDIRDVLFDGWDLLAVMHPPCTRLCNSGVRWLSKPPPGRTLADMWDELESGAALFSIAGPLLSSALRSKTRSCTNTPKSAFGTIGRRRKLFSRGNLAIRLLKQLRSTCVVFHRLSRRTL